MFKKKQNCINHSQRLHKTKQFELFMLIDKCTKIPKDDQIIIRNKIKQQNSEVIHLLSVYKKSNDLSALQVKLRKLIAIYKNKKKLENLEFLKQIKKIGPAVESLPNSHRASYSKKNPFNENKNHSNQKTPIFLKKAELQKKLMKFCEEEDLDSSIHKDQEDEFHSQQFIKSPHYAKSRGQNIYLNETTLFKENELQQLADPTQFRRLSLIPLRYCIKDNNRSKIAQRYRKSQQKINRRSASTANENLNLNEEMIFNGLLKKNPRKFHQEYKQKHEIPLKIPLNQIELKSNEYIQNCQNSPKSYEPKYGQFYKRLKMQLGMN